MDCYDLKRNAGGAVPQLFSGRDASQFSTLEAPFDEHVHERITELQRDAEQKIKEMIAAIKAQIESGSTDGPNETVRQLSRESRTLRAKFLCELRNLRRAHGVSERELRTFERALDGIHDPSGAQYWRAEVEDTPAMEDLDALAAVGYEQLLLLVDPVWLRTEGEKVYRLNTDFLNQPLHLVNGVRVSDVENSPVQRFAQMLLVCKDHLNRKDDLDFFSAAMFVPEIAALGCSLDEITALGPEAERKLSALPSMPNDEVSATIYELLVGAACVRRGLDITMVPVDKTRKVPDFHVSGIGPIAGAIECKRRLGLSWYEYREADAVRQLYELLREALHQQGMHGIVEAIFNVPVDSVPSREFVDFTLDVATRSTDLDPTRAPWGSIAFRRLAYVDTLRHTRLYSPDFLATVFDWAPLQEHWDGMICEVTPPWRVIVNKFRNPICMKWRSESEVALTKKSRGVTSLWRNAIKQIPDGDIGFVYIAYPEGARTEIADARTRDIQETIPNDWHRWSVRVPAIVINRLYPRSVGAGNPDLIESAIGCASKGQEFWLAKLPWRVFTGFDDSSVEGDAGESK